MNPRSIVFPLVFAAVVLTAYLVFSGTDVGSAISSLNEPTLSESVRETYEPLTLQYRDPIRGYSIRYPVGYPLEATDGESAAFYAAGPNGISEMFLWTATEETASRQDLQFAADEVDAQLVSESSVTIDGRKSLRLEYTVAADQIGESARLVQGWIPCGNYSLHLVAMIPDSLAQDKDLADYTLYTARCG